MKCEWKNYTIGDICSSISETYSKDSSKVVLINTSDIYNGDVLNHKFVENKNLKGQFKKIFKTNDILFSEIRPQNRRFAFIDFDSKDYIASTKLMVLRANQKIISSRYLYYYLTSNNIINELQILAETRSGTFPQITFTELSRLEIKIPDLITQNKIVYIIDTLNKKIKLNNYINDNLLNQALTIYNHKIKTFHKNGCIGDYCTVKSGFAFKSAWWVDKGIKVIKISSINQDYLNIHECSFVSADKQEKAKDFAVTFGDLLIAMTGATIGKFAMVPYTSETLLVNQRVGKFYLGNNPIEKLPFIYCTLKQSDVYTEIIHRGQGSAQANISASDIMNVSCSIPQNDIINEFNYITMPLFNLILKNQYENENLKLLRNTLLPKLMSKNFSLSNIQI